MKNKNLIYILIIGIILILVFSITYFLKPKADLSQNLTDNKYEFILKNLVGGGPGKDGIPSIDNAIYLKADESNLADDQIIFGVNYNGFIAAYPKKILYWHEIVNLKVGNQRISITYCPLTNSIIGYLGYELGVSGELYNSNLVMYDRDSNSRIPQILGEAIEGEIEGKILKTFPIKVTTWKNWKKLYPNSLVLSENTGFNRDYNKNPYPGYDNLLRVWFPLTNEDNRLKTKELVYTIVNNNEQIAILVKNFEKNYPNGLEIKLGGENIKINYNKDLNLLETNNTKIKSFNSYWFAVSSDFPEIKLIR